MKCIEDEIPFELPEGWSWCRLENCCSKEIKRGKSPKYSDIGNTLVFAQKCNTKYDGINIGLALHLDESTLNKYPSDEYMQNGDTVINSTGTGTLGRVGIYRQSDNRKNTPIVPDSHVTVIRTYHCINFEYVYYYLKSYQDELEKMGEGSTNQKELKPLSLKQLLLPLPPLEEQKFIISKLNEVMGFISSIESGKISLQDVIKQTKYKILDLAIRGKLVQQDSNDEPASLLLERIRAEKEKLIKAGKIKRDKKESVIFKGEDNSYYEKINGEVRCIDNELPFELPDSWTYVRLKHIGEIIGGGTPKTNIKDYWDGNIPWVTPADFSGYDDMYVSVGARTITELGLKSSSTQMLPTNSVLYSSRAPIGYIAITANPICTNQGFKSVVPYDFAMSQYLYYCLKARTDDIIQRATGTTFKEISSSGMAETIIPMPPLKEQIRIFNRTSQLLNIIDLIEKSLS